MKIFPTIGTTSIDPHSSGEYWNNDPDYSNVLPTVNVTTPVKPVATAPTSKTWLWVVGGIGALLLFGKK